MIYRLGSFDNGDQNALGARILICAAEARPTFARRARAAFGRRPQSYPLRDEPAMHWKVRFARNPSHTRLTNHNGRDGAQSLAVLNISQILMLSLTAKPEHARIKLGSAYSCNLVERPLMLKSFWLHCRLAALPVAVGMFSGGTVSAQDYGAPCGRDAYGSPLQCARPDAGANMESACLTTGRVESGGRRGRGGRRGGERGSRTRSGRRPGFIRRTPRGGETEPDGERHRDQRARARPRRSLPHGHRLTSTACPDGVTPGAPFNHAGAGDNPGRQPPW